MTLTIVSGAAPGVEQGAIEAAVNLALHWQGWASEQSILTVPPVYRTGLQSTSATEPGMVRRLNIQGCDGALVFSTSMVTAGVAAFVDRWTERMGRAFLHVTLNPALFAGGMATMIGGQVVALHVDRALPAEVVAHVQRWLRDLPGRVYITGPSEDDVPGIQAAVRDALLAILEPFAVEEVRQTTRALSLLGEAMTVHDPAGAQQVTDLEAAYPDGRKLRVTGTGIKGWPDIIDANMAEVDKHQVHGAQVPDGFGPTDCRGEPLDLGPPEGLDELQRAQLDASIREAERDIKRDPWDELPDDNYGPDGSGGW